MRCREFSCVECEGRRVAFFCVEVRRRQHYQFLRDVTLSSRFIPCRDDVIAIVPRHHDVVYGRRDVIIIKLQLCDVIFIHACCYDVIFIFRISIVKINDVIFIFRISIVIINDVITECDVIISVKSDDVILIVISMEVVEGERTAGVGV